MERRQWQPPVSEDDREKIIGIVVERIVDEISASENPGAALELVLNDTLYHEKQRAKSEGKSDEMKTELAFLKGVTRNLAAATEEQKRDMLRKIVAHYGEDIAGHYSPRVFKFTTSVLPYGLEALFNAFSPGMILSNLPDIPDLRARISIRGDIDFITRLAEKGTIMVVPTHCSNLDSIAVGWGMNEVDLPPLNYGAGKNLFTNSFLSFFMNSLGAYKVDRRLKHDLYKNILKTYSITLLENGYHSLFFPGGTRSRSGMVEKKLKKGLLGTSITAYTGNLIRGKENPNIYIIPLTINYPIVLEAETLIDDYLKEAGKSRYIIIDDEFSKPMKIFNLMRKLMGMESSMALQFGHPLDTLGHRVNEDGESMDSRGRVVDITKYVTNSNGVIVHDEARDAEYTRELETAIVDSFHRYTVALSTHALAFTIFNMLAKANPGVDLYRLLRFEGEGATFHISEVLPPLERLAQRLLKLAEDNRIQVGGAIRPGECAREVMYKALRFFGMFHTKAVVSRRGDKLIVNDLNLLYYYHNRLVGWGLEDLFREEN